MNNPCTKMTLEIEYTDTLPGASAYIFSIKMNKWDFKLADIISDMVIPLLLAAGYNQESVYEHFVEYASSKED